MSETEPKWTAVRALDKEHHDLVQASGDFAGVLVAVSPSGHVINATFTGNTHDDAFFWSTVITMIQIRLKDIQDQNALPPGFRTR